jgi:hypothetical protein
VQFSFPFSRAGPTRPACIEQASSRTTALDSHSPYPFLSAQSCSPLPNMPAIVDPSAAGPITRETLFELMVLARDTSFLDAQIRAICDTITQENANDSIELLRRLHASQETSLVLASAVGPVKSAANPRSKPPSRQSSCEPGAVLCADTFYRLCKDDHVKLQRLGTFCPFTLNFRKCPHGRACQLKHICWVCSANLDACYIV